MNLIAFILSIVLSWGNIEPRFQNITESELLSIIEFSIEDIELMARVTMSEASTEPYECKQAVVQTMLNRYYSEDFPNSIEEVVEGQFSTQQNGDPTVECYDAVLWGIMHPDIFPADMFWFRTNKYHKFANGYTKIGKTYFSTVKNYNN